MHLPTVGRVVAAVAAVLALAACGTTSPASLAGAESATPTDPNAGLRTGAQLNSLLPGAKDLPKGFAVVPDGTRQSGDGFGPKTHLTAVVHPDCAQLNGNQWVTVAGDSAAFAQTDLKDSYGDEVFAEIDSYRGSDAHAIMMQYRKLMSLCHTYKITASGTVATGTVVVRPGPTVGAESLRAVATSPDLYGGMTYVAVRVGPEIVTVIYGSQSKDLGAAAVDLATAMARRL
jgi:hypothetical protein